MRKFLLILLAIYAFIATMVAVGVVIHQEENEYFFANCVLPLVNEPNKMLHFDTAEDLIAHQKKYCVTYGGKE